MRKIGKYRRKKQKKIIIITSLSLLLFLCVGYAAFQTNLSIIAKGNIKQKKGYEILQELCNTETGDGLYKDIYENNRCIYKGSNPDNYIIFNNEIWRILSAEADKTIKIIKNESIDNMSWDMSGSSYWSKPSDLNSYLNNEYLDTITTNQDKIVNYSWNIGKINIYGNEDFFESINNEKQIQTNAKIGLISATEYIRTNSNNISCWNFTLNEANFSECINTNWVYSMAQESKFWTISVAEYLNGPSARPISINSFGMLEEILSEKTYSIFPVTYLSSEITLSGNGTEQTPYTITN